MGKHEESQYRALFKAATEKLGTQPEHTTSRHIFIDVCNQIKLVLLCKASLTVLPLPSCCYSASSCMLANAGTEPDYSTKTKISCPWGKSEGPPQTQPQPRSVPNRLHGNRTNTHNRTNGRTVLAGSTTRALAVIQVSE